MSADERVPAPGDRVGRYEIRARLGEGAMGVVYRAFDPDLQREVALKLLPAGLVADESARATLLSEARTAAHLNHPGICTVHEVGQSGAQVYIAMELVDGRPLRAGIPPAGLPDETVARLGAQVARALAHAHARHVIHRDLKSANVMLTADGRTKLLDFGLSRMALDEARPADSPPASSTGVIVGTPQYLAPELLAGGRSSEASDVWALGVVLFELCAGHMPFTGPHMAAIVAAITQGTSAPLPAHTGAALAAIVQRCLAREPAHRYASAAEVAAALEALVPGAGAGGLAPGRPRGLKRAFTLGLAVAVLAGAIALGVWKLHGVPPERTVLVVPLEVRGQVRDGEFAGRALAEAIAMDLAQAKGVRVLPVPDAAEIAGTGIAARLAAAQRAGAGRLVVGALAREGDSLRTSISLIDVPNTRVLWGEQRAGSGGDLSRFASVFAGGIAEGLGLPELRRYDYFMYVTGPEPMASSPELTAALGAVRRYELPGALVATQRLVERFPAEPDAHVLRVAALMIARVASPDSASQRAIADELGQLGRLDPESPWIELATALGMPPGPAARERLSHLLGRRDLTGAARGAVLARRSEMLAAMGDRESALTDAEEAVRLDPASDLSLSVLAHRLSDADRDADAAARMRQALALNPAVVNYWLQLGHCMLRQGQWREFVVDLDEAARRSGEPVAILSEQCDGLAAVGRWEDAAERAQQAHALRRASARYALQLAACDLRLGRWDEALPLLDSACRGGEPDACAAHAAARAVSLWGAGRHAEALAQQRAALALPPGKSGAYALACFDALRGERAAALDALERFGAHGWVEPALGEDPNLASLRTEPRFTRVAAAMRAQPLARTFAGWGRSR